MSVPKASRNRPDTALIDAETVDAAANAAGQLHGQISRVCDTIYDTLRDLLAHFHAVLDYPDEDIEPFELEQHDATFSDAISTLGRLADSFDRGRILKNGVQAVIVGRPNAGKSSLLNHFAGFDRVIVTPTPGTTRDAVEQTVRIGSVTVRLLDTAGIRETGDEIERMGVARAEQAAQNADLAIFVCDASQPLCEEDLRAADAAKHARRAVALRNKADLGCVVSERDLPFESFAVSAKTGGGLGEFSAWIDAHFGANTPCDGSILTNARQFDVVRRAKLSLEQARQSLADLYTPDAVLVDVESAMEALGELTGRSVSEDVTSRIFERFCVGK